MEIAEMIEKCRQAEKWQFPQLKENIPHGDMPGDKISVDEDHVRKAKLIFRELVKLLPEVLANSKKGKAVITICGGSGVGKSEIASILNYYFNERGLKGYTLCSGILCEDLNGSEYCAVKLDSDEIMTVGYLIRKGMTISPLGQKYLDEILKFQDKALK